MRDGRPPRRLPPSCTVAIVGMLERTSAVGTNSTTPPMTTETKVSTANCTGRDSSRRCQLRPAPDPDDIPMIVTGLRLPMGTVQRLDDLAGNDKGGRSGVIRRAIDEYLERHAGEAAA